MVFYSIIFLNVWHSVLIYGHTIIYLTNLILLSIFTIINKAEMNILASEHLLLFPYEEFPEGELWLILTAFQNFCAHLPSPAKSIVSTAGEPHFHHFLLSSSYSLITFSPLL